MGHKRSRKSKKNQWPAKLPPKGPGQGCEVRYYETPRRARAAQRRAWASFKGKERKKRPAETVSPFSNRAWAINPTEGRFIRWLHQIRPNANVQRGGWPDFLVESDGNIVGIEVRSGTDHLSPDQIRCMRILERAGIPCYVWKQKKLHTLEDLLREWPRDASGCSRGQESQQKPGPEESDPSRHATLASDDRKPDERTPPVPLH